MTSLSRKILRNQNKLKQDQYDLKEFLAKSNMMTKEEIDKNRQKDKMLSKEKHSQEVKQFNSWYENLKSKRG